MTTSRTTSRGTWRDERLETDPLHVPEPDLLDDRYEEDRRRRPWLRLFLAVLAAILAVYFAGQTAARLWLEDLDARLLDAGAGANVAATQLERKHLEAYRSIAFSQDFPDALARYDPRDIERLIAPVDANHGIPMIDIVDDQTRVVFAFRAEGAIRPIYRDRRELEIVRQALAGERDRFGERFTALVTTDEGPLIATSGPVRQGDRIIGAVLTMTPLDELLSQSANQHGARLSAYSLDRGDPLATTTPIRPRTFDTELRTALAQPERLPYATRYQIAGTPNREQVGALVVRHQTTAFLGAALPDRSREVARQVMLVAAIGMAVMAFMVGTVAYAWAKDRFVVVPSGDRPPLALPPPPPPPDPSRPTP